MSFEVIEKSSVLREILVTIPGKDVARVESAMVEHARKTAKMPGFRAGKVPAKLIRQRAGQSILEDARRECLQNSVKEAIATLGDLVHVSEVEIAGEPDADGSFVAKLNVETEAVITVKDYEGLDVELEDVIVSDEDVETQIQSMREEHAVLEPVTDRQIVENNDIVIVDLVDTEDESKTNNDVTIHIGSATYNANVESELIGAEIDKAVTVNKKSEDGTIEQSLNATVKEIKTRKLPELDDDFALDTGDADTLDDLREVVRKRLNEEKTKAPDAKLEELLLEKLREANPIDRPEGYIKARAAQAIRLQIEQITRQQLGADFIERITNNIKEEELEEYRRDYHNEVILNAIAKEEKIDVSNEDIIEEAKTWFPNVDAEKIADWLKGANTERFVSEQVKRDRAMAKIKETANITKA